MKKKKTVKKNKDIVKIAACVILAPVVIGGVLNLAGIAINGTYKLIQKKKLEKSLSEDVESE